MQHPWWSPALELARHMLVYSMVLVLFMAGAILESELNAIAERLIASKFTFRVLVCLEYAVAVIDAVFILVVLIKNVFRSLRRASR
jgi:hypothetical protein